ncbi:MAG: YerC/YecD family TrpR-related protein [Oscillospiraceae bacterium]|nr:YerC/YecD family TrpR-related protein [Oscillospiraceae bacterium]
MTNENLNTLFNAILSLETLDECYSFFEDLCTVSELKSMSQRMEVALMLRDKRVYTDIAAKTGASTATISRVNRCINYGKDGYNLVIDRLRKDE